MQDLLQIVQYFSNLEIQLAVLLPLLICSAVFLSGFSYSAITFIWLVCTGLTYLTARWEVTTEGKFLHLIPFFLAYVALNLYRGVRIEPGHAYAGTFLSLWTCDMTRALLFIGDSPEDGPFYFGVGGAGAWDGLFLLPLLASLLVYYVDFRRSSKFNKPNSSHVVLNKK